MDYEYEELSYNLNNISFGEAVPILAANQCMVSLQLSVFFSTLPQLIHWACFAWETALAYLLDT